MAGPITRLSTHVLDSVRGRPAAGIPAVLEAVDPQGSRVPAGRGVTDGDGRIAAVNADPLAPGRYRLSLDTGGYFEQHHAAVFYPAVAVEFLLSGDREHYHIAVLAGTYSYTTYLGS